MRHLLTQTRKVFLRWQSLRHGRGHLALIRSRVEGRRSVRIHVEGVFVLRWTKGGGWLLKVHCNGFCFGLAGRTDRLTPLQKSDTNNKSRWFHCQFWYCNVRLILPWGKSYGFPGAGFFVVCWPRKNCAFVNVTRKMDSKMTVEWKVKNPPRTILSSI